MRWPRNEGFGDVFLVSIFCQNFLKFLWDENHDCSSGYRKPIGVGEKTGGQVGWLKDSEGQVLTRVCVCAHADYCDAKPSPRLGETAEKRLHNQNQYNVFTFVFFFFPQHF